MKLNMNSVADQDLSQRVKKIISQASVPLTEAKKELLRQKKKESAAFFKKGFEHLSR